MNELNILLGPAVLTTAPAILTALVGTLAALRALGRMKD